MVSTKMSARHSLDLTIMFSNPYYLYPSYCSQEQALAQEKARALAQQRAYQRARRAVYLPHEEDSSDDEYSRLTPRDRLYLDARQRQEQAERRRREEEALRIKMIETRRQEQVQRERERVSFENISVSFVILIYLVRYNSNFVPGRNPNHRSPDAILPSKPRPHRRPAPVLTPQPTLLLDLQQIPPRITPRSTMKQRPKSKRHIAPVALFALLGTSSTNSTSSKPH